MIIASLLSGLAALLWLGLVAYVVYVLLQRGRGQRSRISISVVVAILLAAALSSTLSASVVVIDAGEVGVVFNVFSGTQEQTLKPGMHLLAPYINQAFRYSTREQVYTMTKTAGEGEVATDDSLWSPTIEGLQVGIDASARFRIDPAKAAYVHNNFRHTYNQVLIRPQMRSIVRHYVSQNTVTDVYGPKRAQIQQEITDALRKVFEASGFQLLSFDIRNVNFTDDYARSIEQKQIAQQDAERMQFVLQKEQQEAERKKIEAGGVKQAAITQAEGEAEALRLINEQLARNQNLLLYRYIEKLSPNIKVMLLPQNAPFILSLENIQAQLGETAR